MKKLIVSATAAVALAVPAVPAAASEIPQPAGVKSCPSGFTGVVVWTNTEPTGYDEYPLCIHGPGAATPDDSSAPAGVTRCGALGHYIVWYYDLDGQYHELWNSCI